MALHWYIVHAYSGFEKRVAEFIQEQARQKGLESQIDQVLVPSEEVVEVRRGRKIGTERKFFPGYVLVHMELTDETWHLVRSTPRVTGFIGGDANRPLPISEEEANRILHQMEEGSGESRLSVKFEPGEQVRVSDGPFATFNAVVEEIDEERARLKVAVSVFGRPTPVELEFSQVEKID